MSTNNPFTEIYRQLNQHPPDPNEPLPTLHKPGPIIAITAVFHILSWLAVAFRLWVRRVGREYGFDDVFVVFAAAFNLASLIGFYGGLSAGMGKHLLLITDLDVDAVFKHMYLQNAAYHTTSFFIKLSLLCQYLRMFQAGKLRMFTIFLTAVVTLWGAAFCFMTWFPCFPVDGFWNRDRDPPAKCYAFGWADLKGAMVSFLAFSASNMVLDVIIFFLPLFKYLKKGLSRREYMAQTALFLLASLVIIFASLRFSTVAKRDASNVETMDFTWWSPSMIILSCLEVDFAIMACSMPIFWPAFVSHLQQTFGIFVTQEVHVTTHQRLEDNNYEMEQRSVKSMNSQEGLTHKGSYSTMAKTNYNDPFVVDHVTGKVPVVTEVATNGKRR
ncbi:hypothetical protein BU24DRAFT_423284 [Aaosphaeria arxii CBS 175.79]|uniref:Rhodopsin domain-containing protein n=1 Tax=Aaosphaeria arxii CBS 175.79 TaxID=1450172 RepID=A0A6A5XN30_9PLEO|nr:uncharacterized protein BU24DRAFT_423284 [Aaosphaeria arxii CBS 175.79]KAF2014289.1 hypothetical protein BU24DRAFT_423284 [Aaosphaeria arxii CBS 175.79]